MRIDDTELVTPSRDEDLSAFNQIVQRYQPQVYNLAARILGDRVGSEDIAQPAPRISLRAAASPVPEQADGGEESTAPAPRAVAEQDAAVVAEPVAAPEVLEPDGESDDGNAGLRLRELQIAVAAFFAALLAAMLWLARRRGRLQV